MHKKSTTGDNSKGEIYIEPDFWPSRTTYPLLNATDKRKKEGRKYVRLCHEDIGGRKPFQARRNERRA
jgi:hypothetical protein